MKENKLSFSPDLYSQRKDSPINRLARCIFPLKDDQKIMLILNAYFDETGDENDSNVQIAGMGGLLAPAYKWDIFSIEWAAALDRAGVKHFHMKEFAHSVGEFKEWKGQAEKRDALYAELWSLIVNVSPLFLGCFSPLQDYRNLLSLEQRRALMDIYYVSYQSCLGAVLHYSHLQWPHIEQVATIFDSKKGFMGTALGIYESFMEITKGRYVEKVPPPIFRDMRQILPLQAADVVAYECASELKRRLYKPQFQPRQGFRNLQRYFDCFDGGPIVLGDVETPIIFYTAEHIKEIAEDLTFDASNPDVRGD